MTNHLQTKHKLSATDAEIKTMEIDVQAMKDEILGEGFKGSIHLVVFDLETTGLISDITPSPHIVEIAARLFGSSEHFTSLVNPECPIPESARTIHHISDDMVQASPPIQHVGQLFIDWTETFSCPQDIILLIAHNCEEFDKLVLIRALESVGITLPDNWRFADSLQLFRRTHPGFKGYHPYSLESLYKRFFDEAIPHGHRADGDINALLRLLMYAHGATSTSAQQKIINNLMSRYGRIIPSPLRNPTNKHPAGSFLNWWGVFFQTTVHPALLQ